MTVARSDKRPTIQWIVAVGGLVLVWYLAIIGSIQRDFDYTYVALAMLGLVGMVVRNATDKDDDDQGDDDVAG